MTSVVDFTRALGELAHGEGPRYRRLADAIAAAVKRGDLLPGMRLPPERGLAIALAISRTTVVQAYARLREAGWLESRHGSGSWIRRSGKIGWPSPQEHEVSTAFRRNVVFRSLIERSSATISFVSAQLSPLPEVDDALRLVADMGTARLGDGAGYFPMGLPALRKAVAGHLGRKGLPTREDQVLITNGAQQAISLVAGLLVGRGETVVTEDPTYIGAIDVFASAGARVLALPGAADAIDLDRLRALLATRPRLLYLVPTFHNPTGALMCEATRREIARLCQELQIPVVEDNAACGIALGARPCPPPIAAFAPAAPILTIGSLSKLFWTGLRVGFIRGPESWIVRLGRFKALSDLGGPLLSQVVAVTLLEHASVAEQARARELGQNLQMLTDLLGHKLPSWSWSKPDGGLLLWVRLPGGDAEELAQIAQRHGVALVAGSANSPDRRFADHVRLPIVGDAATMSEGIARLARAAAEYHPRPRASGFEVVV
jgi:DNA-binding transcriptional MocR family regulator